MSNAAKPDYVNLCPICGWPVGQPWLTVNQVAASLRKTPRAVRKHIHNRVFSQAIKVGGSLRVHQEALHEFIANEADIDPRD